VPSVSGLDLESAVTTLSGLGLRIEFRDRAPSRGQRAGTVLTQDPPARASIARGATVTLTVVQR
jgi:beta-lactam-binding protein with PASTA domain